MAQSTFGYMQVYTYVYSLGQEAEASNKHTNIISSCQLFNPYVVSDGYMLSWSVLSLLSLMAYALLNTRPLSIMIEHWQSM